MMSVIIYFTPIPTHDVSDAGVADTLMFDVGKLTWSVVATTTPNTAVANQVQHDH